MAELTVDAQVIYAEPDQQIQRNVRLPRGATVGEAIDAAGIAAMIPADIMDAGQVGIFARKVRLDHVVQQGDRIEIYRSLTIDPMDARRRRAR